jgi:NAD(P)-dependent dehydrogenase (short-subunit alcohol dehydrogenase family)
MITGTSSGFGFLTAKALLGRGLTVMATMREPEKGNSRAAALFDHQGPTTGRLHLLAMDVVDDKSVETAVHAALAIAGRIDVLVNNAGVGLGGFCESATTDEIHRLFDVNVFGVHRVTRAVLPAMRAAGKGLVINISSIMGRMVVPFAAAYTASKFALEGLSESWRYELGAFGVEVVIVEPGGFPTAFRRNMAQASDAARLADYEDLAQRQARLVEKYMQRMSGADAPDPRQVAEAVVRLVEMPHGTRPPRTVVDPLTGGADTHAANDTLAALQRKLLLHLGLDDLNRVR